MATVHERPSSVLSRRSAEQCSRAGWSCVSTSSSCPQCSVLAYGVRRFIAAFFAFADGTDHRKVVCPISSRRPRKRESIPALQNSQTLFRTPRTWLVSPSNAEPLRVQEQAVVAEHPLAFKTADTHELQVLYFAPKGQSYVSPGQRPGKQPAYPDIAPTGRP